MTTPLRKFIKYASENTDIGAHQTVYNYVVRFGCLGENTLTQADDDFIEKLSYRLDWAEGYKTFTIYLRSELVTFLGYLKNLSEDIDGVDWEEGDEND